MRKITVDPEQLEACASRMDEKNQDYVRHVNEMFSTVETLGASWKGEDNTAFTSKISSYESNLRALHTLADSYQEFLRKSAKYYRENQQTITSMADGLGG